jgi:hypothetical protein
MVTTLVRIARRVMTVSTARVASLTVALRADTHASLQRLASFRRSSYNRLRAPEQAGQETEP